MLSSSPSPLRSGTTTPIAFAEMRMMRVAQETSLVRSSRAALREMLRSTTGLRAAFFARPIAPRPAARSIARIAQASTSSRSENAGRACE